MADRRLLDKICADFTTVYYVEWKPNWLYSAYYVRLVDRLLSVIW